MLNLNLNGPKNHGEMSNTNLKRVFLAIQREKREQLSRREVQDLTGLSWGAVSNNIIKLIEMGIITESGSRDTIVGRRPQIIEINTKNNYLVGIDISDMGICAVVTDLSGIVISQEKRYLAYLEKDYVISQIIELLHLLIDDYLKKDITILSIGVSLQGIVNIGNSVSIFVASIKNWNNIELKKIIENELGITTYLFHDTDSVMTEEKYFSGFWDDSIKNVMLICLSEGIGMSIMYHSEILVSNDGKIGEFGHTVVERNGAHCSCGNSGCLEAYAGGSGIKRRFFELVNSGEHTSINITRPDEVTANIIGNAALSEDILCKRIFMEMGEYLGIAISNCINIFNPDLIVLQGYLTEYKSIFNEPLMKTISDNVWQYNHTKIKYSGNPNNAASVGAALYAIDKIIDESDNFDDVFMSQLTEGFDGYRSAEI